jgi:signal transduction histidine kinase
VERATQSTRAGAHAATAVALLAAVAAVVSVVPATRFHLVSPAAGAIVLTARAMAEIFVGYLAGQRFVRTASRKDFGVAVGVGIMAVADVGFVLTRATLTPDGGSAAAVLPYHFVGAGVLAVAALAPRQAMFRRPRRYMILAAVAAVALVLLLLAELGVIPGLGVRPGAEPQDVALLRLATCALFVVAAVGLAGKRDMRAEPLTLWLGVAAFLAALAQLQRFAEPAPVLTMLTWVHVFQVGVVLALLVGSLGEVRDYHRRLAELAVTDERRRVARELHDGLAQEVAFIASQSKYLAGQSGDQRLTDIAVAAERALDDSRAVVGALTRASRVPLSASIALQAQEFARRWGLSVQLALEPEVDLTPEKEQAILRIVGEALSNAAHHAHASTVNIQLGYRNGPLLVAVSDDGHGFDAEAERIAARGFGLRNMCERARLVGGDVRFVSEPGHGTRVEIAIP